MFDNKQRFLDDIEEVCSDHGMVIATGTFSGSMYIKEIGWDNKILGDTIREVKEYTELLDSQ